VTHPARNSIADDEARWAEAQSILDRAPTESAAIRHRRATRNRWLLVPLLAGLLANAVGQWLGSGGSWRLFMLCAFVLFGVIGGTLMRRDERRARRFLAEHPPFDA